jgi:starch synthase
LARAHSLAGHNVEVVLPFYSSLAPSDIENLTHVMDFGVPKGREKEVRSIHWSPYDPDGVVNADP